MSSVHRRCKQMLWWGIVSLAMALCLSQGEAWSQNILPPLSEWQAGEADNLPPDWELKGKAFRSESGGRTMLAVRGGGEDSAFWRSPTLSLSPGKAYLFRFRARSEGHGVIVSGLNWVNYDFPPSPRWRDYLFAFSTPDQQPLYLRLGQWYLRGTLYFDEAELYPAKVVHRRWGSLVLGEGESLHPGEYVSQLPHGWHGTTIHRNLLRQRAYYNTNRWSFSPGGEVVYRHDLPYTMREARISIHAPYHTGGRMIVSASTDGQSWQQVLVNSREGLVEAPLPESLFPTKQVWVRFAFEGENAISQISHYRFWAKVDYQGETRTGQTIVVGERHTSPLLQAQWSTEGRTWRVRWRNLSSRPYPVSVEATVNGQGKRVSRFVLPPYASHTTTLHLSHLPAGRNIMELQATSGGKVLYSALTETRLPVIEEAHYGQRLTAPAGFGEVWWCEGTWKVGRDRPAPAGKVASAMHIEAARNEWEAAQLVLRARQSDTVLQGVSVSDLVGAQGRVAASQIHVYEVATVPVKYPSDYLGVSGEYPDPLPPLKTPLPLPQGRNQALWILVHVPEGTPAGDYTGTVTLHTNRGEISVSLKVTVFDFALPKFATLRSGFGISSHNIKRYHHLQTPEQEKQVWEMYMRSFAEHRIAPFSFFAHAPIRLQFEGEGSQKRVVVDFSEFDKAASVYLDELGFNGFQLPLAGIMGAFGGFSWGTPEHDRLWGDYLRQIEAHLREKGWLEKAYVYWYDEPSSSAYPTVAEGMRAIRRHAPGIRRLLTERPEPALYGHVDIWCGVTPDWSYRTAGQTRRAGEEVWWYICTAPSAPYIALFIEHPAVELRLWGWQSWQYGVQGILIWETTWWSPQWVTADTPDSALDNPWEEAMSSFRSTEVAQAAKRFWGNGDGRFLYPPRRDPNGQHPPAIEPPSSSIRWENLRDGVEDYEYFVILQRLLERARGTAPASLVAEAERLLQVPPHLSQDLTNFTKDPRPLMEHRRRMARTIERLQKTVGGHASIAQEGDTWR